MSKTEFTVEGDTQILKYQAEGYEPALVLEAKDGQVLLHSREYTLSHAHTQVVLAHVAVGDTLKVAAELTERRLLNLKVNDKTVTCQLNWPSYRGLDLQLTRVELVKRPKRKQQASE
ncbi:MAG: hypothetical protein RR740_00595 [Pseudomonas sp.]